MLITKELALSVTGYVEVNEADTGFSHFSVKIDLTRLGVDRVYDVVDVMFRFVNAMLRKREPSLLLYQEMQGVKELRLHQPHRLREEPLVDVGQPSCEDTNETPAHVYLSTCTGMTERLRVSAQ